MLGPWAPEFRGGLHSFLSRGVALPFGFRGACRGLVAARALKFVQGIGKLPVLVKDSPGFVVNRILLPYMVEAAELFRAGAEAAEIDGAMRDFGLVTPGPILILVVPAAHKAKAA